MLLKHLVKQHNQQVDEDLVPIHQCDICNYKARFRILQNGPGDFRNALSNKYMPNIFLLKYLFWIVKRQFTNLIWRNTKENILVKNRTVVRSVTKNFLIHQFCAVMKLFILARNHGNVISVIKRTLYVQHLPTTSKR